MEPKYKPAGRFAMRFAKIGFVACGLAVFNLGYAVSDPPPLPPGNVFCGGEVTAGLCVMVFIAPPIGLVGAIVGWLIGGIFDRRHDLD